MTVHQLGTRTIGGCLPQTLEATGAIDAAVGVSLPKIQGNLTGALNLQAQLAANPPTLASSLNTALQIVANLQVAITPPTVDVQLLAIADLVAKLQAELGSLQAQLAISGAIKAALAPGGIHLYAYTGEAGQLGNQFQGQLAGGFPGGSASDNALAIMLATTAPESKASLQLVFGTDVDVD